MIVPNSSEFASGGSDLDCAQRLAVMAVDLARYGQRSFMDLVQSSAQHREPRPRPSLHSPSDDGVRRRLAVVLLTTSGGTARRCQAAPGRPGLVKSVFHTTARTRSRSTVLYHSPVSFRCTALTRPARSRRFTASPQTRFITQSQRVEVECKWLATSRPCLGW